MEATMKHLVALLISVLFYTGCVLGMEKMPATIIFENNSRQTLEIPSELVEKIAAFKTAYSSHKLLSSIGTLGYVHLQLPEFQNFELIKQCLDFDKQNPDDIKFALHVHGSDIPYLVKILDMSYKLHMPTVSTTVAQIIGDQFQSAKSRCKAIKNGELACLTAKPEILNLIGQAIIEPTGAKYYWLTQAKVKNGSNIDGLEDQLHKHLSPQSALILLDSYENRIKGTPLSFASGAELMVPHALRDMLKPTIAQRASYKWKQLNPVYKWTLAGLGTTCLAAGGYGFWNWYTSK